MTGERREGDAPEEPLEPMPPPVRPRYDPPAPVVMEEGVFGTPPSRMTLDDLERTRYHGSAPWISAAVIGFALAVMVWLAAYSAAQATGPTVALPVLERAVESLTGLRGLVTVQEPAIRAAATAGDADAPIIVPGFEVPGVALTRAQVQEGSPDDWYASLLRASAEAVRQGGVEALAFSPDAETGGWFSTPGGARLLARMLSEDNHNRATMLLWPSAIASLLLGTLVFVAGHGLGRLQALGVGLVLAAVPVGVAGLAGMGIVAFAGSDGSPLANSLSAMAAELARTPFRNAITLAFAGLAIAVPALIVRFVVERLQPDPLAEQELA